MSKTDVHRRLRIVAMTMAAALLVAVLQTSVVVAADPVLTFVQALKEGELTVDGLDSAGSVTVSPDGKHLYATGELDDAIAVFTRNSTTGFLTFVEVQRDGVGDVDGLDGAASLALSPDGKHVYAVGKLDDALAMFTRDSATGALTFVAVHRDNEGGIDGLDDASSVTVSPDGKHLYVAGPRDSAVAVFHRQTITGVLTFLEVYKHVVGTVDGLRGTLAVVISPDGKHLYAAGSDDGAVVVFSRNSSTGLLTSVEFQQDGVGGVDGLKDLVALTLSPDGSHLYTASGLLSGEQAVAVFSRDSTTGALTFVEVHRDGEGGVDGLKGAFSVTVSPDGGHVYTAGRDDDAVAVFSRKSTAGSLTFVEVHTDGAGAGDGLDGATSVTVSPDGKHLYTASRDDDAVVVLNRNATTGALAFADLNKDSVGPADGLNRPSSIALSPNGEHLYVTTNIGHTVALYSRSAATGVLAYVEHLENGVGGVDGLGAAASVVVSSDGKHVYVASGTSGDAVAVFSRNLTTGTLAFIEAHKDGEGGVDGLDRAHQVTMSPDGNHVYVASMTDAAIAVFSRNSSTGALSFVEVQKDGVEGVDGLAFATSVAVSPDGRHVYAASRDDKLSPYSGETLRPVRWPTWRSSNRAWEALTGSTTPGR